VNPSLVQISIETQDSTCAPGSAVIWKVTAVSGAMGGGPLGEAATTTSETCLSADSAVCSGIRLPFSAISLTPKLAAPPTSNTSVALRWVAARAGVNHWPSVRLSMVTS
jgi:hypothetical protein